MGREAELATLRAIVRRASEGQGGVALVHGEPGIGKSRLLEEAARAATRDGVEVWRFDAGRGGAAPTPLWIQVLGHLDRPPGSPSADPEAVGASLLEARAGQPLLVLVDDLTAVSAADARLVASLVRQIDTAPLAVVCACRDDALHTAGLLRDLLVRLTETGALERLPLRRFDAEEVAEYLRRRLHDASASGLAGTVLARTEGNPFFVTEVVALLLRAPDDASVTEVLGRIPEGVRQVLEYRLDLLPPAVVHVLSLAAVAGLEFRAHLLAQAAGQETTAVVELLGGAVAAGVLGEGIRPGHFRFEHALVRDTLLGRLSPGDRAAMHGSVAEALDAIEGAAADPAVLASHYVASAAANPAHAAPALRHLHTAAQVAETATYWDTAARLYEQALDLAGGHTTSTVRVELLRAAGRCWLLAGVTRPAWRLLMRATEQARLIGDLGLAADTALLALEMIDASPDKRRRLARQLLEAGDALTPAQRARLLLQLAGHDLGGDAAEAAERARVLVRQGGVQGIDQQLADRDYAEALATGDLGRTSALLRARVDLAGRRGDRVEAARAAFRLAEATARSGRLGEASALAEQAAALADAGHLAGVAETARGTLMSIALARWDLAAFDRLSEHAGRRAVADQLRARRHELLHEYDRAYEALPPLDQLNRLHPRVGWDLLGTAARIEDARRRVEESRGHLAAWALRRQENRHPADRQDSLAVVADALVASDDLGLLREVFEESAAWDQVRYIAMTASGLDRLRGALALRLGLPAQAAEYTARALEWAVREGLPVECAAALDVLQRLPRRPAIDDETVVAARALAARAPVAGLGAPHGATGHLSAREDEVLRLVAQGMTNAQIALTLGISPHTVGRHVSSILGKLGVANRAEAVSRAMRAGRIRPATPV